jgi:hypothetical protein
MRLFCQLGTIVYGGLSSYWNSFWFLMGIYEMGPELLEYEIFTGKINGDLTTISYFYFSHIHPQGCGNFEKLHCNISHICKNRNFLMQTKHIQNLNLGCSS